MSNGIDTYRQFLALHQNQLQTSVVPEQYWPTLFKKLHESVRIFEFFVLEYCIAFIHIHKGAHNRTKVSFRAQIGGKWILEIRNFKNAKVSPRCY